MSKVIVAVSSDKQKENITKAKKYCTEERSLSKIIKNIPNEVDVTSNESIVAIRVVVN